MKDSPLLSQGTFLLWDPALSLTCSPPTRSDTTSTILANLWCHLLQNPGRYAPLREEVGAAFPSDDEPTKQQKLSPMSYMNACLYATFNAFSSHALTIKKK
jgi:hypothetical protein